MNTINLARANKTLTWAKYVLYWMYISLVLVAICIYGRIESSLVIIFVVGSWFGSVILCDILLGVTAFLIGQSWVIYGLKPLMIPFGEAIYFMRLKQKIIDINEQRDKHEAVKSLVDVIL
ncbi:MAG: hypothetical protein IPG70_13185 [Moraxellaceae bacterium]|nr:hypothetical protein [Moraxellaceae bacterium]